MSSDGEFWKDDDPDFLDALGDVVLSGEWRPPTNSTSEPPVASAVSTVDTKTTRSKSTKTILNAPLEKRQHEQAFDPSLEDSPHPSEPKKYIQLKTPAPDKDSSQSDPAYVYGASSFGDFGEYMRRKRAKLQIQNNQLADDEDGANAKIFKGVAIYVNGLTEPPLQELREMIMAHGGVFHAYLDKKSMVTHIIASQLTPAKINEYQRGKMKVVRPDWIVKSVEAGVLLRWQDFPLGVSSIQSAFTPKSAAKTQNQEISVIPSRGVDESASIKAIPQSSLATSLGSPLMTPHRQGQPSPDDSLKSAPKVKSSTLESQRGTISKAPNATTPSKVQTALRAARSPTPPAPEKEPEQAKRPSYALHDSNPFAQKLVSSTKWRQNHTSASENFAETYFQNSRLHHLSAWKSELKLLVLEARKKAEDKPALSSNIALEGLHADGVSMKGYSFALPENHSLLRKQRPSDSKQSEPDLERVIMHCDFDSFFVSAGLLDRPHLKGKPIVVCHGGTGGGLASTSEIASASYEARAFGIKNGMSLGQARQLCSDIVTIPYEFEKYKQLSLQFYTTLMSYADDLQACSVDEALLDVSNRVLTMKLELSQQQDGVDFSSRDFAKELAEEIRTKIRDSTSCEVSIGISHNILLARLATRRAKPAGSYHLLPSEVASHLENLPITSVHGVGRSIRDKIQEKWDIDTLGGLLDKSREALQKLLGDKTGDKIWKAVRGIDDTQLESDKPRKSVSAEVNYGIRFQNSEEARLFILTLCKEVSKRLKDTKARGRQLTLKVMKRHPDAPVEAAKFLGHGTVEHFSKSSAISGPGNLATDDPDIIGNEAWRLLTSLEFDPKELRGIGIQIQKLADDTPTLLPKSNESGQILHHFAKKTTGGSHDPNLSDRSSTSKRRKGKEKAPDVEVIDVDDSDDESPVLLVEQPKRLPERLVLPPVSQFDHSVLESLPAEIRNEIAANYRLEDVGVGGPSSIKAPARSHQDTGLAQQPPSNNSVIEVLDSSQINVPPGNSFKHPLDPADGHRVRSQSVPVKASQSEPEGVPLPIPPRATSVSATKNVASAQPSKGPGVRHITRQLAPKHRVPVVSPSKVTLFQKRTTVVATKEELRSLGIDADVFQALPLDIQKEQLSMIKSDRIKGRAKGLELGKGEIVEIKGAKMSTKAGKLQVPPAPIFNRRPPKSRSPSAVRHQPPAPAEKKLPIPVAEYSVAPSINKLTTTPDVQDMISAWVDYRAKDNEAPIEVEVARVEKYLKRCVKAGDTGLERAIAIMKWWRLELRDRWGANDEALATGQFKKVKGAVGGLEVHNSEFQTVISKEWWGAWWRTKHAVDELVKARFGSVLALGR